MTYVTNKQEYTVAWELLRYHMFERTCKDDRKIIRLKQMIRKFQNKPVSEKRVFNADFDGMTLVYPLPEWLESADEADEYFRTDEFIDAPCCAWDCTGKQFTAWYKIFKRAGRFWCYHRICLDV